MRIAANIVTYNRKKLLIESLYALLEQTYPLNSIYIIDNASTDGTPELLKEKGFLTSIVHPDKEPVETVKKVNMNSENNRTIEVTIHYVRMPENTGSSGGQYEGIKRGYEQGFDCLWLMDDDVLVSQDALENLINEFLIYNGYAIVPKTVPNFLESRDARNGLLFAGGLISREVIRLIGLPRPEFFIYFDDIEFAWRMKTAGIGILQAKKATVCHTDWASQHPICKKFFFTKISRPFYPDWKAYYLFRSEVYHFMIHRRWIHLVYALTLLPLKEILAFLFLGSYKKIPFIIKGIFDGITGQMDKRV